MHGTIAHRYRPAETYSVKEIAPWEPLSNRRWHVAHVYGGREFEVFRDIEAMGLGAYVPSIVRQRRVNARLHRPVSVPLYQGYVFVQFDPRDEIDGELWPTIAWIDGVIRLLMAGGHPVPIHDAAMARIREVEGEAREQKAISAPLAFALGAIVRLIDCGGFSGLFAPVVALEHGKRRAQVELEILGGRKLIWLDASNIEAV